MSEAQFNKAVALIKALPEDGPVKLGQEQKLVVCEEDPEYKSFRATDLVSQFYKYYKQGWLRHSRSLLKDPS